MLSVDKAPEIRFSIFPMATDNTDSFICAVFCVSECFPPELRQVSGVASIHSYVHRLEDYTKSCFDGGTHANVHRHKT